MPEFDRIVSWTPAFRPRATLPRYSRRAPPVVRQGDAADALYLVASGRFAVNVDGRRIADVGSGSPIGEIGFFADGIRTATVTAPRDSIVLKLPKAEFAAFAERHPIILKLIAVTLARRLADTLAGDEQSLTHPRTLAVIGAGGFAVPDAFRKRLALALSRFGQIATVDSATLAAALSGGIDLDSEPGPPAGSWPLSRRMMMRMHDITPDAAAESRSILETELDWLDNTLADNRRYLAGDRFSRADITVASLLAFFARPQDADLS